MNPRLDTLKTIAAVVLSLVLVPLAPVSAQVPSTEATDIDYVGGAQFIVNNVPNNMPKFAYMVPPDERFKLTDLIISNPNIDASRCAKIRRDGVDRTGCIVVPGEGTVTINFLSAIGFGFNSEVEVFNGDNAGPIHFTGRGYRFRKQ